MPIMIDEKGFRINGERFFPVGVNYWPRDTAVYFWKRFDPQKIEKEFQVMNTLSINCIRFFIMWDDLSPEIGKLDDSFMEKFEIFHNLASKYNVKLNPTLFIGHMSGQDWFPSWFLPKAENTQNNNSNQLQTIFMPPRKRYQGKIRDIYTDETVFNEAFRQLELLLPKYKNSDTILAWDISNENQYWMRPKTPEDGYRYLERMVKKMKELDPNHPITLGMGKLSEPSGFHSFGQYGINKPEDYYSVHSYPMFYYPMTPQFIDFYITYKIGFDVRMAYCLTHQPVQEQEFGLSDGFFRFRRKKIHDLLLGGYYWIGLWSSFTNGAYGGVLSWCFTDFLDSLRKEEPYNHKLYEMWFGVVNKEYQPKISGKKLKEFSDLMQEIKPYEWNQVSSEVAILLPDHYLQAIVPKEAGNKKAITDDNPIKEVFGGARFDKPDSLGNINRSLFSAYVYCQMNQMRPDFITFEDLPDANHKLIIAPNVNAISKENKQKIIQYCEKGGIFYTSGALISEFYELFGKNKREKEQISVDLKKKRAIAKSSENPFEKPEIPSLDFIDLYNDRMLHVALPEEHIIFKDIRSGDPWLVCREMGKGFMLFATSCPELGQTVYRNMYKKDDMPKFYNWLFNHSTCDRTFSCGNILIEIGVFTHEKNTNQKWITAINHSDKAQKTSIQIHKPFQIMNNYIKEILLKPRDQEIEIEMPAFGISSFIISLE